MQAIGKDGLEMFYNGTIYMEFRVCFVIAKYKNDIFSLFEDMSKLYSCFFFIFQNPFS